MREEKIDFLEEKITGYLTHIAQGNITEEQTDEVFRMVSIAKDMESMGDIIHRNMIPMDYQSPGIPTTVLKHKNLNIAKQKSLKSVCVCL